MKEKASTKILLQKYEMIGKLGQGTEGKVYLVKDLHLDRLAAVKESTGPVAAGLYQNPAGSMPSSRRESMQ